MEEKSSMGTDAEVSAELSTNERFRKNKKVLLGTLRRLGAKSVTVSYNGSGDSGSVEEISLHNTEGEKIKEDPQVRVLIAQGRFTVEKGFVTEEEPRTMPLKEALEQFCYDWIDRSGHSGWENNDGASGEFTIDVESGEFALEHNEYHTETTTSNYTL